jgi:hypothetical protein
MAQVPYNQPIGLSYKHISTGTVVVKPVAGYLDRIVFNGGSSSATVTLYDNPTTATGTVIAIQTLSASTNVAAAIVYNLLFTTGLTIIVTGTVDITVMYK